jgi:hypothetical protein
MPDFIRPTPEEYYRDMRLHYMDTGKEFKENAMRRHVNDHFIAMGWATGPVMSMVEVEEYIPESADRKRQIRRDERDARSEYLAEVEAAERAKREDKEAGFSKALADDTLVRENEALRRQLAELRGEAPPPPDPKRRAVSGQPKSNNRPSAPKAAPTPVDMDATRASADWTATSLREYAAQKDIELPSNSAFKSKGELARIINEALAAREAANSGDEDAIAALGEG